MDVWRLHFWIRRLSAAALLLGRRQVAQLQVSFAPRRELTSPFRPEADQRHYRGFIGHAAWFTEFRVHIVRGTNTEQEGAFDVKAADIECAAVPWRSPAH
jgi:hypothetical protein